MVGNLDTLGFIYLYDLCGGLVYAKLSDFLLLFFVQYKSLSYLTFINLTLCESSIC